MNWKNECTQQHENWTRADISEKLDKIENLKMNNRWKLKDEKKVEKISGGGW